MRGLSDEALRREFARRKRINAYGYVLTFLVIILSFFIAWASGAQHTRFTTVAFGICMPFVVAYLIVKSVYWRCPACGFRFPWSRSRIGEYFGSEASCGGCKRTLAP